MIPNGTEQYTFGQIGESSAYCCPCYSPGLWLQAYLWDWFQKVLYDCALNSWQFISVTSQGTGWSPSSISLKFPLYNISSQNHPLLRLNEY